MDFFTFYMFINTFRYDLSLTLSIYTQFILSWSIWATEYMFFPIIHLCYSDFSLKHMQELLLKYFKVYHFENCLLIWKILGRNNYCLLMSEWLLSICLWWHLWEKSLSRLSIKPTVGFLKFNTIYRPILSIQALEILIGSFFYCHVHYPVI